MMFSEGFFFKKHEKCYILKNTCEGKLMRNPERLKVIVKNRSVKS